MTFGLMRDSFRGLLVITANVMPSYPGREALPASPRGILYRPQGLIFRHMELCSELLQFVHRSIICASFEHELQLAFDFCGPAAVSAREVL